MDKSIGFDHELYMVKQKERILERIEQRGDRLYLEFGGKLVDDYHAARVLPGFDPAGKIKLLQSLSDRLEILFCICAGDIERNRLRADIGIPYDRDVLRLMDTLRSMNLTVSAVVITQYDGQPAADTFRKKLELRGVRVFVHRYTKGYPTDVVTIVSDEGYGANPYIPCTQPLVIVTAPGPASGKLATCLSQMYHEHRRGERAGYAKFETFPIWNLPLHHPIQLAYEAATVNLDDVNMIDPFHLEAYGETTVNYNRDIEVFPILRTILTRITGTDNVYRSPTDMGVNMIGDCIVSDEICCQAARQEILRRYYRTRLDHKLGRVDAKAVGSLELIMSRLDIKAEDRTVVAPALLKQEKKGSCAVAIELPDKSIVTGRATELMTAPASAVINAIKKMSGVGDRHHLISPQVLNPIKKLKKNVFQAKNPVLNLQEVLVSLSISAVTNPMVEHAIEALVDLRHCEAHATYIMTETDENALRKLGIELTCEPEYASQDLYHAE